MILLCRAEEIAPNGAKGIVLDEGADRLEIVVVQKDGRHHAYINSSRWKYSPSIFIPRTKNILSARAMAPSSSPIPGCALMAPARTSFSIGSILSKKTEIFISTSRALRKK